MSAKDKPEFLFYVLSFLDLLWWPVLFSNEHVIYCLLKMEVVDIQVIIITLSGILAHFAGLNGEFCGLKYILARRNKPIKSENQIIV